MLRLWRQKFGINATYLCLLDAFESLKWRDLIIELLDLFDKESQESKKSAQPNAVPRLGK